MKLLVDQLTHGALSIPQSRTALGKRRPSVIGATTFNHWSAYYSDSEELYFLYPAQVQGAENGPVIEHSEYLHQRLHTLQTRQLSTNDASRRCPAFILRKEDNNNNNSLALV